MYRLSLHDEPTFSVIATLHLIGIYQAGIFAVLFLLRGLRPGNLLLAATWTASGAATWIGYLSITGLLPRYFVLSRIGFVLASLLAVLFYLAVRANVRGVVIPRWTALLHFVLPALGVLGLVPFWLSGHVAMHAYVLRDLESYQVPTLVYCYVAFAYGCFVLGRCVLFLRHEASGAADAAQAYLRRLTLYAAMICTAYLCQLVLALYDPRFIQWGASGVVSALALLALAAEWLFQQERGTALWMEPPAHKYARSELAIREVRALGDRITEHFRLDRPYLDPDYRLLQLAQVLGESSNRVSQAINRHFGRKFTALVNEYRVREVERQMRDGSYSEASLLRIALDCGFNSKASFNRAFRQVTGRTPGDLRKELAHRNAQG